MQWPGHILFFINTPCSLLFTTMHQIRLVVPTADISYENPIVFAGTTMPYKYIYNDQQ